MLQRIQLENLVLVDSCEVLFSKGFTAITGESGSGKSILLAAIHLLLGEKADSAAIRLGEKAGAIEGDFVVPPSSAIASLFEEFSLDLESCCTIRRELFASGKNRSLVNGCVVPLQFLKRLAPHLVEISSQHAYLALQEENAPQKLLDLFAGIEAEVKDFQNHFEEMKQLQNRLDLILQEEPLKLLEVERLTKQLQDITASKIFETDDAALFSRLQELENAKEILNSASSLSHDLEEGKESIFKTMSQVCQRCDRLQTLSPRFTSISELCEQAFSLVREASQEIYKALDSFEYSDEECARIESSLRTIDQIKRLYGSSHDDIRLAQKTMKERLTLLEAREDEIEQLKQKIPFLQKSCDTKSVLLHDKRKQAAVPFQKSILNLLSLLHMPQALFDIEISPSTRRTTTGDDVVRFFLTPNTGEKRIEVKEGASGGEMARLFLAIQAVMARLSSIPTIIFDEIDASIGGVTASSVGDLLSAIGKERQVFAITHFTQVAAKASSHIALFKETIEGRTLSRIRDLASKKERELEHLRMVGTHEKTS